MMTDFPGWLLICIPVSCLIVVGFILSSLQTFLIKKALFQKSDIEIQADEEALRKHQQHMREKGLVIAPAVVVAAKVLEVRGTKHSRTFTLEYEVDVTLDNGSIIHAKIIDDYYRPSYEKTWNQMTSEHGRKFWVVFYSNDTSKMWIDHFGEVDYEVRQDHRRFEFNKIMNQNEELKLRGESAEAIITRVDDLELPYPKRDSCAMNLFFDVTPAAGTTFQAEGYSLMVTSAFEKYSVGKKVYVCFDPQNPKWAVLDTERNKSL